MLKTRLSRSNHRLSFLSHLSSALLLAAAFPSTSYALALQASEGVFQAEFGYSVAINGDLGLVGAVWEDSAGAGPSAVRGAGYIFRSLSSSSGTITEAVKLTAGDDTSRLKLGSSAALLGNIALLGAEADTISQESEGSVFVYFNVDTATGTVTRDARLIASDATAQAKLGSSLSVSGNLILAGADGATVNGQLSRGATYLYRDITAAGSETITQTAKLLASDGDIYDHFGGYVAIDGNIGIVASPNADWGGKAYLYRDLDTATGTVYENTQFYTSDYEGFSGPVSIDGTNALLVAGVNAYLYRGLDNDANAQQEVAILTTYGQNQIGPTAVALAGSIAIVGDGYQNITNDHKGFAFIYLGLDTATGLIAEDLQLVASDGVSNDMFGSDVAIGADGDSFIIGAYGADGAAATSGKAYYGTISSLTTLDKGNTTHEISKISFVSYHDWIIGKNNSNNSVSLGAGDSAEIASDTGTVSIGQNAGSNSNLLTIKGHLTAQEIFIGSTQGNTGNTFRLEETATFTIDTIYLASGNILQLEGEYIDIESVLVYLGPTQLKLWTEGAWQTITIDNAFQFVTQAYNPENNSTNIEAIPEPTTWVLLALGAAGLTTRTLLRSSRKKRA